MYRLNITWCYWVFLYSDNFVISFHIYTPRPFFLLEKIIHIYHKFIYTKILQYKKIKK
jgi:hypothetical protein